MAMLSTGKKANINDQDGAVLSGSKHSVTTSDANAVGVALDGAGHWVATNHNATSGPLTATLSATRTQDGATATLDVTAAGLVPFSIALGPESAA